MFHFLLDHKISQKIMEVELDTPSDWVTSIRSLIRKRIFKLKRSMSSKVRSIFNDKDVVDNIH